MEIKKDRVLVIDDCPEAADALVELLHLHNVEATACYSVDEGTEQALKFQPTLIIIDQTILSTELNETQLVAKFRHGDGDKYPLVAALINDTYQKNINPEETCFDVHLLKSSYWDEIFSSLRTLSKS